MNSERITAGPAWLEWVLRLYATVPWRAVWEWSVVLILAFITAVGLVALFEPLRDIMRWKGLL